MVQRNAIFPTTLLIRPVLLINLMCSTRKLFVTLDVCACYTLTPMFSTVHGLYQTWSNPRVCCFRILVTMYDIWVIVQLLKWMIQYSLYVFHSLYRNVTIGALLDSKVSEQKGNIWIQIRLVIKCRFVACKTYFLQMLHNA